MGKAKILGILWVILSATYLNGQFFGGSEPAEPEISTQVDFKNNLVRFILEVPDDHHITDVKNNFFRISLAQNDYLQIERVVFPQGEPYGDEQVFKGRVPVDVFVKSLTSIQTPVRVVFTVAYQICQEQPQEMCFAPGEQEVEILLEQPFSTGAEPGLRDSGGIDTGEEEASFVSWMERVIKEELDKGSLLLFLLVFAAGFLTSLTPCVYPIIPIVMGYVGSRAGNKKLKGLILSLFFVLGLALVYSILGVIAAQTGSMIGISFQNPVVVILIAAVFILMGLSLAGLFEIPVPASLTAKLQSGQKSGVVGAILVGGVSGIIAAPCVGPVLIALLSWISQTGNIFLGFWLTFTFSLGLGVIFLLAGTFSGILSSLPKGGAWMNTVKYVFSLLLIAGGLYFLNNITAPWLSLLLWGVFLISASVFMGLFKTTSEEDGQRQKIFKVIVVLIFLLGAFFLFQSLEMRYFGGVAETTTVQTTERLSWLAGLEEGREKARKENRIMMVDTYADWCVACKELDKHTFSHPDVVEVLTGYVLVKLDFTLPDEKNERMRKSLNVIGMPTVIFFDAAGKELKRFSGFVDHKEFLRILSGLK